MGWAAHPPVALLCYQSPCLPTASSRPCVCVWGGAVVGSWNSWACEYLQVCPTWSGAGLVPVGAQGTLQTG